MEMTINVSKWKIHETEQKQKTIAGTYQVKMAGNVISESTFNDGYGSTEIVIPAELMVEAEALDAKIKEAIVKNFTE